MLSDLLTTPRRPLVAPVPALPVFVYGSLRTGLGNWDWALRGRTTSERLATLDGALMYSGGGFPYVVRNPKAGTVLGQIMEIVPEHYAAVMDDLDALEGYNPADKINFYDREVVTVTTLDGEQVQAYVYVAGHIAKERISSLPIVESGDWVRYLGETPRKYR